MKRLSLLLIIFAALFCLCACGNNSEENWGSFTAEKTYSYDQKYYAIQEVEEFEDISNIKVTVYLSETGESVYSFNPARASDFWGICWEKDSYNIWVQSADIGVLCYTFNGQLWVSDENAVQPDYIQSRFD